MADIPRDDLDDLDFDFSSAIQVGTKVIEMCDRVETACKFAPGAQARWAFEMDGKTFEIVLTMKDGN